MKEDYQKYTDEELSFLIIGSAIEVHRILGGPGLLESAYVEALCYEMQLRGLQIEREVNVSIHYKGMKLATPLRLDIFVNHQIIVECKAVTQYNTIFERQLLTYLRLTDIGLGLVLNFGDYSLKNGIRRVTNHLSEDINKP